MNQRKAGKSAAFKGEGFIGILDEVATQPQAAVSIRRLTAVSWATSDPILKLRRSSDNEEAEFSYDVTNELTGNSLSFNSSSGTTNGQTLTTWASSDTLYVTRWYNQAGNNYFFQSTTTNQPTYSIINGITNTLNQGFNNVNSSFNYEFTAVGEMYNGVYSRTSVTGVTDTFILNSNLGYDTGRTNAPHGNGRTYAWFGDAPPATSQKFVFTPAAWLTTDFKQYYSYRTPAGAINILGVSAGTDTTVQRSRVIGLLFKTTLTGLGGTHKEHIYGIYNSSDNALIQSNQSTYYGV